MEYNRKRHSEIGCAPLRRLLDERDVGRPCPSSETLRSAFRQKVMRTQRRSDGTLTVEGRRYEVPSRYRNIERLCIRYARRDLSVVELYDDRAGKPLCVLHPLDKERNADERRRTLEPMLRFSSPVPIRSHEMVYFAVAESSKARNTNAVEGCWRARAAGVPGPGLALPPLEPDALPVPRSPWFR